jgi:hypothetical protein
LTLEAHARPYKIAEPDGQTKQLLAVTIMVVNRRKETIRCFADVTFTFQVRLEVHCQKGLHPRTDLTGRGSSDLDAALADLHYPDVADDRSFRFTVAARRPSPCVDPAPSAPIRPPRIRRRSRSA